jgi:hypothetical protein
LAWMAPHTSLCTLCVRGAAPLALRVGGVCCALHSLRAWFGTRRFACVRGGSWCAPAAHTLYLHSSARPSPGEGVCRAVHLRRTPSTCIARHAPPERGGVSCCALSTCIARHGFARRRGVSCYALSTCITRHGPPWRGGVSCCAPSVHASFATALPGDWVCCAPSYMRRSPRPCPATGSAVHPLTCVVRYGPFPSDCVPHAVHSLPA